ncbi:hypothetical protein PtA15_15A378 [Puccinia triticina]|uniref:Uncharacterized protein n=1 Tax=Puccinia triticina TaxID=208348 RepID=A0ABY7D7K1_9BASI|nr:uncharacterized protein PtA15_15A378 [Puccinia triticina]WAQ91985.1 hypothetical protein PtA15_15A378 [Puccinia triticina]
MRLSSRSKSQASRNKLWSSSSNILFLLPIVFLPPILSTPPPPLCFFGPRPLAQSLPC